MARRALVDRAGIEIVHVVGGIEAGPASMAASVVDVQLQCQPREP